MASITPVSIDESGPGITGSFDLGRVSVILGVNGAGKTRLLQWLARAVVPPLNPGEDMRYRFWRDRNVLLIEGNRVIALNRFRIGMSAGQTSGRTTPFEERLFNAFLRRAEADGRALAVYRQEFVRWDDNGRQGALPTRPPSQVNTLLDLLKSYFVDITLEWITNLPDGGDPYLVAKRAAKQYSAQFLSEGEKQIVGMLIELSDAAANSVLLVDEPELHLHPQLAESFWAGVEDSRPEDTFVYATHSLSFAMRDNVEKIIVLSRTGDPPLVIDSVDDLPPDDARQFLGAIPGILKAGKALATEGEGDESVDRDFYRWLLGESNATIVPLGSCDRVRKAVQQTGAWGYMAPHAKLCGVIDRDYRPDDEIESIEHDCVITAYHEVESYLCEPKFVSDLSRVIDTTKGPVAEAEVRCWIAEHCKAQLNGVVAQRVMRRVRGDFNFGMVTGGFGSISKEVAIQTMRQRADQQIERLKKMAGDNIAQVYEEEERRCLRAIATKNSAEMLKLFPVKSLVQNKITELLGCRDINAIVRAANNKLSIDQYPELFNLRTKLLKRWAGAG